MKFALTVLALVTSLVSLQAQAQTMTGPPAGGTPPSGGPSATAASATLIGTSVTVAAYYPDLSSPNLASTVTVSTAVEIACPDSTIALCDSSSGLLDGETIDIGATGISGSFLGTFSASTGDTFNGYVFTGLNFGSGYAGISGFTLTTDIAALSADRITFTANSVSINMLGIDPSVTTDGSSVGTFAIAFNVSPVPEPGSAPLLAGGLIALAVAMRRKRANA